MHHNRPKFSRCSKQTFAQPQQGGMMLSFILLVAFIVALVFFAFYVVKQNRLIVSKFEGKRWDIPATVYSKPLELYQGVNLSETELSYWLNEIDYHENSTKKTGSYIKKNGEYTIYTRQFDISKEQIIPEQILKIQINNNKITNIQSTKANQQKVHLAPVEIGGIYPDNNENRIIVKLQDVPQTLIDALIATEDRAFYEHHGISIRGTARAFYTNLTGGKRQGGSTITQQLVKNFYLNSDKTIKRKANEAIMAMLLEHHYSKEEILQTYINEINLGQNGNLSINGFGLASRFYFKRDLKELSLEQIAMLVGLAKGPTQYNPLAKDKTMALQRRNTVLHNMLVMGKIDQKTYDEAIKKPLFDNKPSSKPLEKNATKTRFSDYLDIVKRELNKIYYEEDLKSQGLKIFTSFDPLAQRSAMLATKETLEQLKGKSKNLNNLQSALVSANPQNGELLAVVGSSSEFTGFNRAVDAKRQVGSLLKPIIYLTDFEEGIYNLASGVSDNLSDFNLGSWKPSNYSGANYGTVPVMTSLANSYNKNAVYAGMKVGVPKFINQLYRMGITTKLPEYPSTLLGAVDLSPMDMLGIYQVLATGGVKHDIHTIRSVVDSQGRIIQQNSTAKSKQVISPSATYLTNIAMQQVIKSGTAKSALTLGENLNLAGKTGTTNDSRDAWFAGYSGNYVNVVWIGLDDNKPIHLTGGTGALPMWINYMKRLHLSPVNLPKPDNIEYAWFANGAGYITEEGCGNAVYLPFDTKYRPEVRECSHPTEVPTSDETPTEEYSDENTLEAETEINQDEPIDVSEEMTSDTQSDEETVTVDETEAVN